MHILSAKLLINVASYIIQFLHIYYIYANKTTQHGKVSSKNIFIFLTTNIQHLLPLENFTTTNGAIFYSGHTEKSFRQQNVI